MRYKTMFLAGAAVGFVAGARAGRERYDQMVKLGRQVSEHPTVQKVTQTVTTKTTEISKTAAAKAPDVARNAAARAPGMARSATSQVPKIVGSARQKAAGRRPFGNKGGSTETALDDTDPNATDGQVPYQPSPDVLRSTTDGT